MRLMKRRITAFIMAFCMMITVLSPAAGTIAAEDLSAVSGVTQELPGETMAEPSEKHTPAPAAETPTEQMTETKTSEVIAGLNTKSEVTTEAVTEPKTEVATEATEATEPKTEAPTEATEPKTEASTEAAEPKTEASTEATEPKTEAPTEATESVTESTEAKTEASTDVESSENNVTTEAPVSKEEATEAQTNATESVTEKQTEAVTEEAADDAEQKELAVTLKAGTEHAFANEDSVELKVKISGGKAPYTLVLKEDGDEIQRMESIEKAGKQTLTYRPTEFGEHTLKVVVKDSNDGKVTATAEISVAVNETEKESDWKETFKNVKLTGDWRKDLVEIAKTQIGYEESERNFIINKEGKKQGYTRYGAWYGSPYEEWCAMFVSFCLNYAEIKAEAFPREAECIRWMNALSELNAFTTNTSDYTPVRGDLIFFNVDGEEKNPAHVGIVEKVSKKNGKVYTIEGNSAKQVRRCEYDLNDGHIAGYGSIEALMERAEILEQFQTELPVIPEGGVVGTTNTGEVNVREGAGTDYPVVMMIEAAETEVTVLAVEEIDGEIWYQVTCGEATGYVRSDFVDVEIPEVETEAETKTTEIVEEAVSTTVVDTELSSSEIIINEGGEVLVYADNSANTEDVSLYDNETSYTLSMSAAGSEGEQSVMLSQYGKVTLSVDQEPCQWQVEVAGQWINMAGETGAALDVTYAKVVSLFNANGYARIRCVSQDGQSISDTANVYLTYNEVSIPEMDNELDEAPTAGTFRMMKNAVMTTAEEGDDETEPEKVIVEIAYQFANTEEVATPYVAEIGKGGDLITSVIELPVIQGYVASYVTPEDSGVTFVPPTADTNGTIQLNLSDVMANTKYVVTYVPTYVNFTVEHYLMGFDSEMGTAVKQEADTQTNASKKTGEAVGAGLAKNYTGFTALWYDDTTKVAADGSTTIKIYYERNYYLMLFDLEGGYGVEPIYAMYGDNVSVETPTRAGYTFQGWSLDGTNIETLPGTMPAENRTYKAVWKANETAKVSVVIWGENANDEGYSYIKSSEFYAKPGETITFGSGNLICGFDSEHTHNANCYSCGEVEHTHSTECCPIKEHTHGASCCTIPVHTHSTECYDNVSSNPSGSPYGAPDNAVNGQIYTYRSWGTTRRYMYLNGSWYSYSGNASSGTVLSPNCNQTTGTHVHGDGNCNFDSCELAEHTHNGTNCEPCELNEHTHTSTCMTCTIVEHTHNSDCYMTDPGMSGTLWTYVKSDTVTVAADGSTVMNVYYDRTTFTLTFRASNSTVATITDKWGASISDEFLRAPFNTTYNGRAWQCTDNSKYGYALQTLDIMPQFNATFNLYSKSSQTLKTIYYYVENVGANVSHNTWPSNANNFTLLKQVATYFNYATYQEEYHEMEGFTRYAANTAGFSGSRKDFSNNQLNLYYLRNTYILEFNDGYDVVREEDVEYGASLSTFESYVPDLPSAYEAGSRTFAGWYLNPECTGEEYDLSANTMPPSNLVLYAKWDLVTHTVEVYPTETDSTANNGAGTNQIGEDISVLHGNTVAEELIPANPTNGNYTFVGWFYRDVNGVEKAFDFKTMPINRNLKVYAKWNATEPVTFTIYYRLADESGNPVVDANGKYTDVADPLISKAMDGTTITQDAKTGNDLYTTYRTGHFPLVSSHSLIIDITAANEFTFWYKPIESVPYRVVYLKSDENGVYTVHSEKLVEDNTNVVVTENYLRIPGYMPDAYQKRLIVSANGTTTDDGNYKTDDGENIIFFYYHRDTKNAYYTISHYIEPIGGVTEENPWQEYRTGSYTGEINKSYSAEVYEIPGFTFKEAYVDKYTVAGGAAPAVTGPISNKDAITQVLSDAGMDFRLYYERNKYPYKVQYLESGTTNVIAPEVTREPAYYQDSVNETNTLQVHGFDMVSGENQTLTIKIDGDGTNTPIEKNIITFYYKRSEADINYVGVAPDGTLIDTAEEKAVIGSVYVESESVIALGKNTAGTDVAPAGSTASAVAPTYKFVGWYLDQACTQPVPAEWISGDKITPQKQDTDGDAKTADLYASATYYAKFEYNLTTLTINKTGLKPGDTVIFSVHGENKTWEVAVTGGNDGEGSVTLANLTVGQVYTITEKNWSWRYTNVGVTGLNSEGKITLQPNANGNSVNVVTFANKPIDNQQWLDDEDCTATNVFTKSN